MTEHHTEPRAGRIGEPVREEPLIVPAPPRHQPVEPSPRTDPAPPPARPAPGTPPEKEPAPV